MDIRHTFGSNLKHYRTEANMSQAALAVKMGVDRAHVSAMERGQQNVTIITLWHVAQALDIAPAALLNERDEARLAGR
ncbi:helix-turn-helix domain-containing protein [Jannaschia donghaensis]|uniref:HTH-type transcriptional regulator SinR n=1 Tax=Jannaschia donghaensis TaxID=420998 RepID=A0A0M6YNZ6_9RHOB|nr:helix-turn-helix transcriptional regulator [Jannaschia donghaensis]CTQ50736.1 HTH-type transcriptional regulator SinR [Jannaschia donghaensis]